MHRVRITWPGSLAVCSRLRYANRVDAVRGLIDTHCHLDVAAFDADRHAVLNRAWAAGLSGVVIPAIGPDRWDALLEWPGRDARVQVALGIHPQWLPELPEQDDDAHLTRLDALLAHGIAAAVGECGLDGATAAKVPWARQRYVLEAHLELARKHDLPALVHCLRAHPALQELLRAAAPVPRGLLMHSYSGSAELVSFYVERGCSFSFAGPVTYLGARKPIEAVRRIPLARLMAETDAPDQAPHPARGQRSEPALLPHIVEALAKARPEAPDIVARATADNARAFFESRFSR